MSQNEFIHWMDHRAAARRQHAELAKLTGVGNGRMLELFSGSGEYLAYFQEKNWECLGLETDDKLADESMMTNAVPTLSGDPKEVALPRNSYDMVRIRWGLNHYNSPHELLTIAYQATAPTGFLVVDVWNKSGFPCRHKNGALSNTYDRKQLKKLVQDAGFEVGGLFAPAVGDPVWCPLNFQSNRSIPSMPVRMLDSLFGFLDRGSLLVLLAQKPPKDKQ